MLYRYMTSPDGLALGEIEITPEMIEAGADVLAEEFDGPEMFDGLARYVSERVMRAVFGVLCKDHVVLRKCEDI